MTKKGHQAPSTETVPDPRSTGKPQTARPSQEPREAVIALSVGEIARIGVGLNRVILWMTGMDPTVKLADEDLAAVCDAASLVGEIADQINASIPDPLEQPEPLATEFPSVYTKLAALIGVSFDSREPTAILQMVRRCVAKLEHDRLRKG